MPTLEELIAEELAIEEAELRLGLFDPRAGDGATVVELAQGPA